MPARFDLVPSLCRVQALKKRQVPARLYRDMMTDLFSDTPLNLIEGYLIVSNPCSGTCNAGNTGSVGPEQAEKTWRRRPKGYSWH
jgi:hypothetical protein